MLTADRKKSTGDSKANMTPEGSAGIAIEERAPDSSIKDSKKEKYADLLVECR